MHELLLSLLWENDHFKAYFTSRPSRHPNEYLWFTFNKKTGERQHWVYILQDSDLLIVFNDAYYEIREIITMQRYGLTMLQWSDTDNPDNYMNWMGSEIPETKGEVYVIKH